MSENDSIVHKRTVQNILSNAIITNQLTVCEGQVPLKFIHLDLSLIEDRVAIRLKFAVVSSSCSNSNSDNKLLSRDCYVAPGAQIQHKEERPNTAYRQ